MPPVRDMLVGDDLEKMLANEYNNDLEQMLRDKEGNFQWKRVSKNFSVW